MKWPNLAGYQKCYGAKTIHETEEIEKLQAYIFISERIVTKTCFKNASISRNKFSFFSAANTSSNLTTSRKEKQDLKKDIQMFSRLYIASQVRGGDIQKLFSHGTRVKADLFSWIKTEVIPGQTEPVARSPVKIWKQEDLLQLCNQNHLYS